MKEKAIWAPEPGAFIHSFIHSFTHSLAHSCTHSLIHSLMYSCINSFTHSLISSFTHLCIYSFIHSCIHSLTHSFTHSFIHSLCKHLLNTSAPSGCLLNRADKKPEEGYCRQRERQVPKPRGLEWFRVAWHEVRTKGFLEPHSHHHSPF